MTKLKLWKFFFCSSSSIFRKIFAFCGVSWQIGDLSWNLRKLYPPPPWKSISHAPGCVYITFYYHSAIAKIQNILVSIRFMKRASFPYCWKMDVYSYIAVSLIYFTSIFCVSPIRPNLPFQIFQATIEILISLVFGSFTPLNNTLDFRQMVLVDKIDMLDGNGQEPSETDWYDLWASMCRSGEKRVLAYNRFEDAPQGILFVSLPIIYCKVEILENNQT